MSKAKVKDVGSGIKEVKRTADWVLCGNIPKKVQDLPLGAALLERRFGPSGRLFEEVACHP